MHKTLAIVLFLILAAAVHKTNSNISLEGCRLSCNENEHQVHDMLRLTAKVTELQAQFDDLKGQVRYASTGWTKASNDLYYKLFDEKVNYEAAKSQCAIYGARLPAAGLRAAEVRREIMNFFPKLNNSRTWIGLDDLVRQGSYVWSDGVKSTTENTEWYPGEPNHHNERCAIISTGGDLHDYPCARNEIYLCELSP